MAQLNLFGEVNKTDDLKLPDIDIYLCGSIPLKVPMCCIASSFGFNLGMRSDKNASCGNCKIGFIDNDFMKYDHETHLSQLDKYRPKLTSVIDYFSEYQCSELGIPYRALEEIEGYAEDCSKYAEQVILIPKTEDGIKDISNIIKSGWIIGVPTGSFGKAQIIPPQKFTEYDVKLHILGGSPKTQTDIFSIARDQVISMDSSFISTHTIKKIYWNPKNDSAREETIKRLIAIPGAGYAPFNILCGLNCASYYRYLAERCSL